MLFVWELPCCFPGPIQSYVPGELVLANCRTAAVAWPQGLLTSVSVAGLVNTDPQMPPNAKNSRAKQGLQSRRKFWTTRSAPVRPRYRRLALDVLVDSCIGYADHIKPQPTLFQHIPTLYQTLVPGSRLAKLLRFQVWAPDEGLYLLLPCLGGVRSIGTY